MSLLSQCSLPQSEDTIMSVTLAASSGKDAGYAIHEALGVIIAKLKPKRKLSASSIKRYHFPVVHSLFAEVTLS